MNIEEYYDIENRKSIKKLPYGVKIKDTRTGQTFMSPETYYALDRGLLKEEKIDYYFITVDEEV